MAVGIPRVLVADQDDEARSSVCELVASLGMWPDAAATGTEALAAAERADVALALLSVDLAEPCGYEVLHRMRIRYGEALAIAVLSATEHSSPRDEVASLLLGADDYFAKPLQVNQFLARVRRLVNHPSRPSSRRRNGQSRTTTAERAHPELTNREHQVLALLVSGHRTSEIAARLCITRKTAATHIERILPKLGAHSQAQAVAFAIRDGLVPDQGPAAGQEISLL